MISTLAKQLWFELINNAGPSKAIGTLVESATSEKLRTTDNDLEQAFQELFQFKAICQLNASEASQLSGSKKLLGSFVIWKKNAVDWMFLRVISVIERQRTLALYKAELDKSLQEAIRVSERTAQHNAKHPLSYELNDLDRQWLSRRFLSTVEKHFLGKRKSPGRAAFLRHATELQQQRDVKKIYGLSNETAALISELERLIPSKVVQNRREAIPEAVRSEVWRRDGGRCVDCKSREKLEFDHIIPFSEGGANTVRNLQLLCESCNRSKGAKI